MRITLIDAGKRYNRDWIFRHLSYEFQQGNSYAITGPNGSGKSTLLQAIAGAIGISEGELLYEEEMRSLAASAGKAAGAVIAPDQVYNYISLAAPYLELIEEMTAAEFLQFHQVFKPLLSHYTISEIVAKVGLGAAGHKQIRYYSSGMKQRVKLAQALFSDTPVILLDEPCTNLDAEGIELYQQLIGDHCAGRLVIVSSNDVQEYAFCREKISIMDFKK